MGELCPDNREAALLTEKPNGTHALMDPSFMRTSINTLLSRSQTLSTQVNPQPFTDYNTHRKQSGGSVSTAASYILVLSIIPPQ
jgi:hypothetical protein